MNEYGGCNNTARSPVTPATPAPSPAQNIAKSKALASQQYWIVIFVRTPTPGDVGHTFVGIVDTKSQTVTPIGYHGENVTAQNPMSRGFFKFEGSTEFTYTIAIPIEKEQYDKAAADIAYLLTPSTGTASWGYDLRKFNCSTFALWFVGRIIPQNLISTLPNATHGGSAVQSGVSGDPPGNPNGKFFSPEGIWDYFKRWARNYAGIILTPDGKEWASQKTK